MIYNMKRYLFVIFLGTIFNLNAQSNEEVIKSMINDVFELQSYIESGIDTILLCKEVDDMSFDFDSTTFYNSTGFKVSNSILNELSNYSPLKSEMHEWDEREFNKKDTLYLDGDTIIDHHPYIKCISCGGESITKNQYAISTILYDKMHRIAVFYVESTTVYGSYSRRYLFASNLYSKWVILCQYLFVMS